MHKTPSLCVADKVKIIHQRLSIFKPLKPQNKIRQKKECRPNEPLSFAVTRTIYPAQYSKGGRTIGKGNESTLRSPACSADRKADEPHISFTARNQWRELFPHLTTPQQFSSWLFPACRTLIGENIGKLSNYVKVSFNCPSPKFLTDNRPSLGRLKI